MKPIERVYRLLAIRPRSEKEIRDYFKISNKKQTLASEINGVIEILKLKGLIDDVEFAKVWVESRRRSKKKGRIAIKQELFQKGIGREIIDEIVEGEMEISEEELAEQALEKRLKRWESLDPLEFRKKAMEFLMRRGFEFEVAKEVVEKLVKKV